MINTQGKLLFMAFFTILLGVVLIQPIGDDIELAKLSSITVTNETLSFTTVTTDISNESQTNTENSTASANYTLTYNNLTAFTELRNQSATVVNGLCNVTLSSGTLYCNETNSTNLFSDYTYVSGRTETLANDEIISLDAIRNATSPSSSMLGHCNITLSTGSLICNNTHYYTGYCDYKYEPDTYVHSSTARVLLTNTSLFFAIAVLLVGIGFAIAAFKQSGAM